MDTTIAEVLISVIRVIVLSLVFAIAVSMIHRKIEKKISCKSKTDEVQ